MMSLGTFSYSYFIALQLVVNSLTQKKALYLLLIKLFSPTGEWKLLNYSILFSFPIARCHRVHLKKCFVTCIVLLNKYNVPVTC